MTNEFDVFGRHVQVVRADNRWLVYYSGTEGKRRPARDIMVPAQVSEGELERYLDDLCHEWATPGNPRVIRLPSR